MLIEFLVPIYNEEKILEKNILKLFYFCQKQNFNFEWNIILIINGSNDNSFSIARKLNENYPKKILVKNLKKGGKGYAIKTYLKEAEADIVFYMDVDLAVSLENINDLLLAITKDDYDLAIGSRLLASSKIKRSIIREITSQGYNFISRIILNHKIADLQCGFKAIKKDTYKKITTLIKNEGWFFDTELVVLAKNHGYKIKEIGVDWSENRYEKRNSKVKIIKDSLLFIKNLFELRSRLKK